MGLFGFGKKKEKKKDVVNEKQKTSFDELFDKMLDGELDDPDEFMDELIQCEDLPACNTRNVDDELADFWDDINFEMEEMDKEEKRKEALLEKPDSEKTADELYENALILYEKDGKYSRKEKSLEHIVELLLLADEKGHEKARSKAIEYLKTYAEIAHCRKNHSWGTKFELQAAELGDAKMQYKIGHSYYNGTGMDEDKKEAFKWFEKAADQGYEDALYYLGCMYLEGTVVGKDDKKAFNMFQKMAENGHVESQCKLGIMYLEGIATEKNLAKALELLEIASENRSGEAKYRLGLLYYEGKVVEKDDKKAFDYIEYASEYEIADAMYLAGQFYEKGIGTEVDMEEAYYCYAEGACYDHEACKKRVEELKAQGIEYD